MLLSTAVMLRQTERQIIREKNWGEKKRKKEKPKTKKQDEKETGRQQSLSLIHFSNGEALLAVRAHSHLSLLMTKIEMSRKSLGDGGVLMTTARQTCHTFAEIAAEQQDVGSGDNHNFLIQLELRG